MRIRATVALLLFSAPLQAQSPHVAMESAVFVERSDGSARTVERSNRFERGERVVTVLRWQAPRGRYTVTSAVPPRLQFERASMDSLQVSTDGGRNWRDPAQVQPEAVTHLRWLVGNGSGRLTYSAIVR